MFSLDKQHCNVYPNVHVHVHVQASLYCHREYTMCSWCHTILLHVSLYSVRHRIYFKMEMCHTLRCGCIVCSFSLALHTLVVISIIYSIE